MWLSFNCVPPNHYILVLIVVIEVERKTMVTNIVDNDMSHVEQYNVGR